VWLAWAPNNALDRMEGDITARMYSGDSTMSEAHYHQVVMFLENCIVGIQYHDAFVQDDYPDVSDKVVFLHETSIM
jgi:hypothetical protein